MWPILVPALMGMAMGGATGYAKGGPRGALLGGALGGALGTGGAAAGGAFSGLGSAAAPAATTAAQTAGQAAAQVGSQAAPIAGYQAGMYPALSSMAQYSPTAAGMLGPAGGSVGSQIASAAPSYYEPFGSMAADQSGYQAGMYPGLSAVSQESPTAANLMAQGGGGTASPAASGGTDWGELGRQLYSGSKDGMSAGGLAEGGEKPGPPEHPSFAGLGERPPSSVPGYPSQSPPQQQQKLTLYELLNRRKPGNALRYG